VSSSAGYSASLLYCTKCGEPFPSEACNAGLLQQCVHCATQYQPLVFPAILHRPEGQTGEALVREEDASCFYHPTKKAVIVCEGCGVFLCALCDVVFKERHFCSKCIEKGKTKGKIKDLEHHRVLYDDLALTLATLPVLLFWVSLLTAPIACYIAIRYWNAPGSLVPRTKIRFLFAIVLSLGEMVGWFFLIRYLVMKS